MQEEKATSIEAAQPPKELTLSEYKNAMRMFFTYRHQANVDACGHAFHQGREPRHRNCDYCWFAFFQVHGEVTQTADEVFQKEGREMLVQLKGKKFTEMFVRFMATLAQYQRDEQLKIQESNANSTGLIEGSSETNEGRTDESTTDTSGQVEGA